MDLKEIKKLVFPQAEPPAIVSEDAGLFSHIMSYFQQYEKTVSRCLVVCVPPREPLCLSPREPLYLSPREPLCLSPSL